MNNASSRRSRPHSRHRLNDPRGNSAGSLQPGGYATRLSGGSLVTDRDDQTYGLQTADGPTEAICLSDRATAEWVDPRMLGEAD
ncbi:Hypothetical protein PHPALM_2356 [Phytophthora palmivora]|uniref:Uncharacterized protein n=1 Tax=Phytophthora palmivora TaxID=4796 RepID=A0A2P4YQ00_9STRA|nr:Hypothetical protein PHPALM_2356 [Phytophthora palmivora]